MSETDYPAGAPRPPEDARADGVDRTTGEEVADREEGDRPDARRMPMEMRKVDHARTEGDEGESRLAAARRKHAERLATLRLREANEPDPRALKGLLRAPAGTPGISLAGVDLSTPEGCGLAEDRVLELALTNPLLPPIWAREMSILLRDRAERKREMARRARGEPPGPDDGRSRRK